jgi:hypothetical protein
MNLDALLQLADPIGALLGFLLTLLVFSYIFGDNGLFRLAIHIFIGVASAYATALIVYNIILNQLILPMFGAGTGQLIWLVIPLFLGVWMLFNISPRLGRFGSPMLAYLVGAGAATAIGGAILGTLFPQVGASINLFDLTAAQADNPGQNLVILFGEALLVLVGTLLTLIYFHFGASSQGQASGHRHPIIELLGQFGQGFIAITFGALFAGVYMAALSALIERVVFVLNYVWGLISQFVL